MATPQSLRDLHLLHDQHLSSEELLAELRAMPAERPASGDRDAVARWLAIRHLATSAELTDVYYFPHQSPAGDIRLLEVNDLSDSGEERVQSLDFGFDVAGLGYQLFVAEIGALQQKLLRGEGITLPDGWSVEGAWHWTRPPEWFLQHARPDGGMPFHVMRDLLDLAENQGAEPGQLRRLFNRLLSWVHPTQPREEVRMRPR